MYGTTVNEKGRAFIGGLLKSQLINGYEWPLFMDENDPQKMVCLNNVGDEIRKCLDTRKQKIIIILFGN